MAIIARGLGLTAVVGLRDFYQRTRTGDQIVVDARRGEVILHPAPRDDRTVSVYVHECWSNSGSRRSRRVWAGDDARRRRDLVARECRAADGVSGGA